MGKLENKLLQGIALILGGWGIKLVSKIDLFQKIPYISDISSITQILLMLFGLYIIIKGVVNHGNI